MDHVIDWLNAKSQSSRVGALLALAVVPLVLVGLVAMLFNPAAPLVGALAGGALFLAAYGYWHTVLPAEKQDETDLKARYPLKQRRGIVGAVTAVWLIVLLLFGRLPFVPSFLLGTLNVFVLISLYWIWRATPEEAAEQLAAYEAAQAAKEAEAQAELEEDYIMDGYDDMYDN